MSKSVCRHLQLIADSLSRAQVVVIWTEDGALAKGTMLAYFLSRNAAQVLGTAAQLVVLV